MKRNTFLSVGLLVLMLTIGGTAYGQGGMDSSSDQGSMGSSSGQSSMGSSSDQSGMGGTSGQSGMGSSSESYGAGQSSGQMQAQIDINTASAKDLEKVPGMSKSMAKNIVKYRDQNGPFASIDDLTKVKGVSEKKLNAMRQHLTVGAATGTQPSGQSGTSGSGSMGTGESSSGTSGGMGTEGSGGTSGSGSSGSMGGSSSGSGSGY